MSHAGTLKAAHTIRHVRGAAAMFPGNLFPSSYHRAGKGVN